jgi:ABC-type Fe3+ transport system substrate-binding protein
MGRFGFIFVFLILLGAPLVIRAFQKTSPGPQESTGARLVIITPHGQEIRNEFRRAFADWSQKKYGEAIDLEYLTPGGTGDIRRQLDTIYRAIRDANGGKLPPEDQIHTGIDMVWGGGDFEFNSKLKPMGILRPLQIDPKLMAAVFPSPTLAGVKLYDQEKDKSGKLLPPKWVGICLSSFGIIFNPDLYRSMGIPQPQTWSDLTDPRLFHSLSLADPSHSQTAAVAYMMVIQRGMADAEDEFLQRAENAGKPLAQLKSMPQYQAALDAGWKKGMGHLVLIAGNARFFTDSSAQPPNDVASGDAAAGMAIDFYARVTEETVGSDRENFVLPRAATAITPDPIAILYGTHGKQLELANRFIEFLLSPEGQRLWILKVGTPGGPREVALRRPPIRRDIYADQTGWADTVNYFQSAGGFNERGEWMTTFSELPLIWAAAMIDAGEQLRDTCRRILMVPDDARRNSLFVELSNIPISRAEVTAEIAEGQQITADHSQDPDIWRARKRLMWSTRFANYYRAVGVEADAAASVAAEK